MFCGSWTRAVRLGLCLASFGVAATASAEQRVRTSVFADLLTPSMIAEARATASAPPRRNKTPSGPVFFTINGVLAKMDGKQPPEPEIRVASLDSDRALALALRQGGSVTLRNHEPFSLLSFKAPEGALWKKWRTVSVEIENDVRTLATCAAQAPECGPAALRFRSMLSEVARQDGRPRIEAANRLINDAIQYTTDLAQWGELDHWSSPLESLKTGRGDCEDYAIAKYVMLREAGVAESDLRILLGRDNAARQDHAVLAVRDEGSWLILDNRFSTARVDAETTQFKPLFAVDSTGVSLMASPLISLRTLRGVPAPMPASSGDQLASGESADWGSLAPVEQPAASPELPSPM